MSRQSKRRGFTLIELLIVVAIIAILAAIAVPNFLHAQMRARIARVQSDFHTLFLSVEMYRTDHGLISANEMAVIHSHAPNQHAIFTTPIKYMTAALYDPFFIKGVNEVWNCVGGNIYTLVWGLYHVEPMNNNGIVGGWLPAGDVMTRAAYKQSKQYLTLSVGPGLMDFVIPGRGKVRGHDIPCGVIYDITNGILSPGDLIGFGPP